MATTAEIKAGKRADLDAIAVELGIDPQSYTNVKELKEALLPLATDAEKGDEDDTEDAGEDEGDKNAPEPTKPVNDAEKAADKAEQPRETRANPVPTNHAAKFDANGQPIFGRS